MTTSTTLTTWDDMPPKLREAFERQGVTSQAVADDLPTVDARRVIRAALAEADDLRAGRHPLGTGADAGQDYRRRNVRDALKSALFLFYAGVLAQGVNSREDARVGMRLADRFVSHLEISLAMDQLANELPALHILLTLRYRERWEPKRIAGQLSMGRDTFSKKEKEALDYIIERVWRDAA